MIPNIVHFNYGLMPQDEDFLFVYYIAVLSCKLINNPDKIYFYYHYEPKGPWWEKTKELVELIRVDIPTHIGSKEIKKVAHKSDILRLKMLQKYGGIYLDIDTICIRSYKELLYNKFVIPNEITDSGKNMGLCNAIMMSESNSSFINEWLSKYEESFNPDGWQEASTFLPFILAETSNYVTNGGITILKPETMLKPSWEKIHMIFKDENDIPEDLIVLHYWNQHSIKLYLNDIKNFDWILDNSTTLYGKALINILNKLRIYNDYIKSENIISNFNYNDLLGKMDIEDYSLVNGKKITDKTEAIKSYLMFKKNNMLFSSSFKNDKIFSDASNLNSIEDLNNSFISRVFFKTFDFSKSITINSTTGVAKHSFEASPFSNYYKIILEPTSKVNYHIHIKQHELETIIFNMENYKMIYILPEDFNINLPVANILIKPNICIKDSKFIINTQYISHNLVYIIIRRTDNNWGWHQNLYLDIQVNNKKYYFYVGKSSENSLSIMLELDEILSPVNLVYDQIIPKKVFQTWETHELDIQLQNTVYSITEKNPEYEYKLYNSIERYNYIKDNYGSDVLYAYDNLIANAFKADLFRYCVLYKEGGVYIDCKMIMVVPFRDFIKPDDKYVFVKNTFERNDLSICNGFICSQPNNKLFIDAINKIIDNVRILYFPSNPFLVTGPNLLYSLLDNNENITYLTLPYLGYDHTHHNNCIINDKNQILIYKNYKNYYKNHRGGLYIAQYNNGLCYKNTISLFDIYNYNTGAIKIISFEFAWNTIEDLNTLLKTSRIIKIEFHNNYDLLCFGDIYMPHKIFIFLSESYTDIKFKLTDKLPDSKLYLTKYGFMEVYNNDILYNKQYKLGKHWDEKIIDNHLHKYILSANYILDIGGHIGNHSVAYAKINDTAKIYTFESQKRLYKLLKNNIFRNNIKNVEAFNVFLGNKIRKTTIATTIVEQKEPCSVNELTNLDDVSLGNDGKEVDMITIDSMKLEGCDFIKIDVEEFEIIVLLGGEETIKKFKPVIFFEINHEKIYKEPIEILKEFGYNDFYNLGDGKYIAKY